MLVNVGACLTDRASAAGATVLGAPSSCLFHRLLLGAQTERCRGARQLQALVRLLLTPAHGIESPDLQRQPGSQRREALSVRSSAGRLGTQHPLTP